MSFVLNNNIACIHFCQWLYCLLFFVKLIPILKEIWLFTPFLYRLFVPIHFLNFCCHEIVVWSCLFVLDDTMTKKHDEYTFDRTFSITLMIDYFVCCMYTLSKKLKIKKISFLVLFIFLTNKTIFLLFVSYIGSLLSLN